VTRQPYADLAAFKVLRSRYEARGKPSSSGLSAAARPPAPQTTHAQPVPPAVIGTSFPASSASFTPALAIAPASGRPALQAPAMEPTAVKAFIASVPQPPSETLAVTQGSSGVAEPSSAATPAPDANGTAHDEYVSQADTAFAKQPSITDATVLSEPAHKDIQTAIPNGSDHSAAAEGAPNGDVAGSADSVA
jgi:hypothetical protein